MADKFVNKSQLDASERHHQVRETSGAASGGRGLPALSHAFAGSVAAATSSVLLYPLDLVITRLQVQRHLHGSSEASSAARDADAEYANVADAVRKIYNKEGGLKAFYTGVLPSTGKSVADAFLFFLAYSFLQQRAQKRYASNALQVLDELRIGMAAGAFARFITTPISNIVTRQQTAALVAARDPTASLPQGETHKFSVKDVALQIHLERGIQGFWAGYSASIILTLNPSITFLMHNVLRQLLPKRKRETPGSQVTFLLAAFSKAIATSLMYPVSLDKARSQVKSPAAVAEEKRPEFLEPPESDTTKNQRQLRDLARKTAGLLSGQIALLRSLRKTYETEGLLGLYSGLEGEVVKGFLSHGLTMLLKEQVHMAVIKTYFLLANFMTQ